MEGQRFSHYEILERLGGGGMGVVYKALDTKLNRHVALKFLPRELTRDDEARLRFMQEARSASALDHPNICTIHEIDSTPDGQMFIAMALYDGETLKKRIDRGPLPIEDALDIAMQVAKGLTKAHSAGIVHRDIKPANVMVTKDGFVKIVDFGIAKLLGVTGPTQAGSTLGTVSYMSPEQVAGEDADPRSDVYALGAVLYEMLTGRLPFPGENQWAVMNAIANREAEPPRSLRREIPAEVESVVMHALQKERDKRIASAEQLRRALEACHATAGGVGAAASASSAWQVFRRPSFAVPVMGAALALGLWAVLSANRGADATWAREEAIPEMLALIGQDDYVAAFGLAEQIERLIPNDPVLADAWTATSVTGAIITEPPGADVYVKPYAAPDAEWRLLGQSPIDAVRLPLSSAIQLRVEKPGFETRVLASGVPGFYFGRAATEVITLSAAGAVPAEMVFVPGGDYPVRITGFNSAEPVPLGPFLIDRYEVTNAEYKEFVAAGAYQRPEYWEDLEFILDGERLSSEEAMAEFVDQTGRPGPSTWEFGDFPSGRGDYPVTGVSWYEAVAYTRFRGKELPTIYHWARAALEPHNNATPLASAMIPLANFGGEGPAPVGSSGAMGPHGTVDIAGNAKEWTWTASGDHYWLLGGAWDDDPRMQSVRFTSPPFDRSPGNGFRGVKYLGERPSEVLTGPVDLQPRDFRNARAVSDEIYDVYRRQMAYVPSELNARVEGVDEGSEEWSRVHVTMDAGYEDERFSVYLFLPKAGRPPYQVLVYFPGVGPFQTRPLQHSSEAWQGLTPLFGDMVKSGRAVAVPIWNGSYERWDDFLSQGGEQYMRSMRTRMAEWAGDLGRTIDYLETRDDIRADGIAYWGISFGSSTSLALLALEERLKAALLMLPGYTYRELPAEADAVNFVPRVTLPVLMIGGKYDYVFPIETAQRPLFDQLGTPLADKQHMLYEMGHGPFPRGQTLRDVPPWLDKYLGPVQ